MMNRSELGLQIEAGLREAIAHRKGREKRQCHSQADQVPDNNLMQREDESVRQR